MIVWKLDRLARSLRDLVNILHDWEPCGIGFQCLVAQQGVQRTWRWAVQKSRVQAKAFFRFGGCSSHQATNANRWAHAKASYNSAYGEIVAGWKIEGNQFNVNVAIPPNTTAIITLPATTVKDVLSGGKPLQQNALFRNAREEGGNVVFDAGSGSYAFSYAYIEK